MRVLYSFEEVAWVRFILSNPCLVIICSLYNLVLQPQFKADAQCLCLDLQLILKLHPLVLFPQSYSSLICGKTQVYQLFFFNIIVSPIAKFDDILLPQQLLILDGDYAQFLELVRFFQVHDDLLTLIQSQALVQDHLVRKYLIYQREVTDTWGCKLLGELFSYFLDELVLNLAWPICIVFIETFDFQGKSCC